MQVLDCDFISVWIHHSCFTHFSMADITEQITLNSDHFTRLQSDAAVMFQADAASCIGKGFVLLLNTVISIYIRTLFFNKQSK